MQYRRKPPESTRADGLPFDPAAAVCEDALATLSTRRADIADPAPPEPGGGSGASADSESEPELESELESEAATEAIHVPVAASGVVDLELVVDYDRELEYLKAEGRRGVGSRPSGFRG